MKIMHFFRTSCHIPLFALIHPLPLHPHSPVYTPDMHTPLCTLEVLFHKLAPIHPPTHTPLVPLLCNRMYPFKLPHKLSHMPSHTPHTLTILSALVRHRGCPPMSLLILSYATVCPPMHLRRYDVFNRLLFPLLYHLSALPHLNMSLIRFKILGSGLKLGFRSYGSLLALDYFGLSKY